jgi:protein-disulfide isomerase
MIRRAASGIPALLVLAVALVSGCNGAAPEAEADTAAKAAPAASGEQAKAATAEVLASLTPQQQEAVRALVRDTLLSNPQIMDEVQVAYEARQRAEMNRRVAEAAPGLTREHAGLAVGPANARITVVQFFDYKCPFCHQSNAWVQNLIASRRDVRVIFKELPVLSENSTGAARAAIAAQKQEKYLAFHNALMTARGDLNPDQVMQIAATVGLDVEKLQQDMASESVTQTLEGMRQQASSLGISGTPAFIINGQLVNGWIPEQVEAALAAAAPGGAPATGAPAAGAQAPAPVAPGR